MTAEKVLEKVEEAKAVTTAEVSEPPKEEGSFKIKKVTKPKQLGEDKVPKMIKVDLSKPKKEEKDAISIGETKKVDVGEQTGTSEIMDAKGGNTTEKSITPIEDKKEEEIKEEKSDSPIQEITDEEDNTDKTGVDRSTKTTTTLPKQEKILQEDKTQELPENVEKLVKFMKETGGTIEDYARLNADYSNVDNGLLLQEYYKKAKPHLNAEEVNFIIEDTFQYDEEVDDEREIKKKKLAYKEEVAKATNFLEDLKKEYYAEIKLRPGVTQEQQKAMDFFNRHNKEQGEIQKHHDQFKQNTKNYFNQDFKGFEFNLGEKRFRYNVNDINGVVENQSALSNFTKKFLNKDGSVSDLQGYHKALYAAQNADNIANHFYEQGRADAVKNITAKSKNISNESRKEPSGDIFINGLKVKAINGVDSSKLKIKKRKIT